MVRVLELDVMPTHRSLIKQLQKALGTTVRGGTGVDLGGTYRGFRRKPYTRTRVPYQVPIQSRQFAALNKVLKILIGGSRVRVKPYMRKQYRGKVYRSYQERRRYY